MADEPSIPMDQEEEDNDEYFSAKESPGRKLSQECLKSSTPTPQKSERAGPESSPSSRKSTSSGKSDRPQFFSDEAAMQGSENSSTKKSEKVRRLKDKNRWDMREYKKEELDGPVKPKKKKKKKSKNKKKEEVVEKSKTDEESDEKEDPSSPLPQSEAETPRPFFQSQKLILQVKSDKPIAPKCKFRVLRFAKTQEVVEYDTQGEQHLLDHYNERAISNPWRRWGAHRALCDQGGYLVDKNKKLVEIKRGSDPPKCPPNPRQVTLNKNCEAPDSQTMMGTLRVEVGPAEEEVHRIGRAMEDYVLKNGGFVPPPLTRKEMQAKPTKGQPMVVVQTKGGVMRESSAVRKGKKSKPAKTPKKSSGSDSRSGEESEENTEEGDSTAEKAKKPREPQPPSNPPPQPPQPMDYSRKGGGIGGFLKRKKDQFQQKSKSKAKNNKGSVR